MTQESKPPKPQSKTPELDALVQILGSAMGRSYSEIEHNLMAPAINSLINSIRGKLSTPAPTAIEVPEGPKNG